MHLPSIQIPSDQNVEGLSRRGLVQVLAAGAAASIATPSLAQQGAQASAVLAEATSADYVRDPTRWGSPEVAALFPGFKHIDMRTKGANIRAPPLTIDHSPVTSVPTASPNTARRMLSG